MRSKIKAKPRTSKRTRPSPPQIDKYELYEASVQSPEDHAPWFAKVFRELTGRDARNLREDFCGTFRNSVEWIKLHPQNTALGLDLDPEPLLYGEKHHLNKLTPQQRERIKRLRTNVLTPPETRVDYIIVCNFSFYIFKERAILLQYLKSCRRTLASQGVVLLEMAGGPGMISTSREQKTVKIRNDFKFKYIWHQKSFDPIQHDALYSIHIRLPNGEILKDLFTYDWRLWTIPEVKDLMKEAGFKKVEVLWESSFRGEGTGEYLVSRKGDNAYSWIAYVVGLT